MIQPEASDNILRPRQEGSRRATDATAVSDRDYIRQLMQAMQRDMQQQPIDDGVYVPAGFALGR